MTKELTQIYKISNFSNAEANIIENHPNLVMLVFIGKLFLNTVR